MQLINLELEHFNLYYPSTGEEILSSEDVNENAKSLKAYWVDEVMYEPFIKDETLEQEWKVFIEKYEEEHDEFPDSDEIEDFLVNYPENNWIIYKITTSGMACGPVCSNVWNILDMNTKSEDS